MPYDPNLTIGHIIVTYGLFIFPAPNDILLQQNVKGAFFATIWMK